MIYSVSCLFSLIPLLPVPSSHPHPRSSRPIALIHGLCIYVYKFFGLFLSVSVREVLEESSIWPRITFPNVGGSHPVPWGLDKNGKMEEGRLNLLFAWAQTSIFSYPGTSDISAPGSQSFGLELGRTLPVPLVLKPLDSDGITTQLSWLSSLQIADLRTS